MTGPAEAGHYVEERFHALTVAVSGFSRTQGNERSFTVSPRIPLGATLAILFIVVTASAPASQAPAPAAPQIAFPGQYAATPAEWKYPVWPKGCSRFEGQEKTDCLEFVAADFGRLARYAAANAALVAKQPGETRVVFFGDSITDNWSRPTYGGFFPGKAYVNRGIGGQTTAQMLIRFRADVIALAPDAVVILAGTNDVAGNAGPVSPESIQRNVATMAELARPTASASCSRRCCRSRMTSVTTRG